MQSDTARARSACATLLNEDLDFPDVVVPDVAFEHDLKYSDAVPMLPACEKSRAECGLDFGVKLSNTLEVENSRSTFDAAEKTMYLSGRPLHAITVNLAHDLADEFDGELSMSFSAGANCFNAPALLAAGMQTITACSDLLKTGGYLRLLQYLEEVDAAFDYVGAASIEDFIFKSAESDVAHADVQAAAQLNLSHYAQQISSNPQYIKDTFDTSHTKTSRELGLFDCIQAPCVDECPVNQKVPQYMSAVRNGDIDEALRVVRADNPAACILGRVCDHLCEQTCVRTHLDEPVAIRDIKRFVMDRETGTGTPGSRHQSQASGTKGCDHRGRPRRHGSSSRAGPWRSRRWKYSNSSPMPVAWSAAPCPNIVCRRPFSTRISDVLETLGVRGSLQVNAWAVTYSFRNCVATALTTS